jgi:hypothetical protein
MRCSRRLRAMSATICLCFLALVSPACGAHAMPKSLVSLEFQQASVEARLRLPIDRLQYAMGRSPSGAGFDPMQSSDEIIEYLRIHIRPLAPDGQPWAVLVENLRMERQESVRFLVADLRLTPPAGAPSNRLQFNYDAITHEIVTHTVLVSVRSDWKNGVFADQPVLIGVLRNPMSHLSIDRSAGSVFRGFAGMLKLGMTHIAEGTDHLIFLLVLLLTAPLIALNRRWTGVRTAGASGWAVLKLVTAFSLGHSLTLAAGALGWIIPPQRAVEAFIAVSILVSAVHALRPIFAGYEVLIAASFGLVHGLAFAAALAPLGLEPLGLLVGLVGFNLGIECMQLVVVAVILPWLVLLRDTRLYDAIRVVGAWFSILAATGWVLERACDIAIPPLGYVTWLANHALWLVTLLATTSIVTVLLASRRSAQVQYARRRTGVASTPSRAY